MNPIETAYREFVKPLEAARKKIWGWLDEPEELVESSVKPKYHHFHTGKISPDRAVSASLRRLASVKKLMLPGETTLKDYVHKQSIKFKQSQSCIRDWITTKKLRVKLRRINQRVVFVKEILSGTRQQPGAKSASKPSIVTVGVAPRQFAK